MSLIYQSLQKLSKDGGQAGMPSAPQAVSRNFRTLVLRSLLYFAVFSLIIVVAYLALSREVRRLNPPAPVNQAQDFGRLDNATLEQPVQKVVEPQAEQAPEPRQAQQRQGLNLDDRPAEKNKPTLRIASEDAVRRELVESAEKRLEEPVDLTKPSKALESHFAKQAKRNEGIITIERELRQSVDIGDMIQAKDLMERMSGSIGATDTGIKHKWSGYLAMKEKRWDDAVMHYQKAVAAEPADVVSNINLSYSLLGAGKPREAVAVYRKLIDQYPMDTNVLNLARALGER